MGPDAYYEFPGLCLDMPWPDPADPDWVPRHYSEAFPEHDVKLPPVEIRGQKRLQ
jgi:hypothetical protein